MKKTLSLILVLVLAVALLAGCGSKAPAPAAPANNAPAANNTPAATQQPNAASASEAIKKVDIDESTKIEVGDTFEWPEMTIIINDYNPQNSGPATATQKAADHIEEVSGGKIKCEVYFGGTLMESTDSFAGTADGMADITYYIYTLNSGVSTLHTLFCAYYVREMPNAIGMFEVINNTLDKVPEFREEFTKQNLWEICCTPTTAGPMQFNDADLGMSIKTPDDLKGHIVQSSGYNTPAWAKHGVSGMAMPPSEWYTNLERGIVDALTMNLPGCNDFGLVDVTNCYVSFGDALGLYSSASAYFANLEKWNSWPQEVKDLVTEAFKLGALYNVTFDNDRMWEVYNSEMAAGKKDNRITEEERQPWYDLALEALDFWKEDVRNAGVDPDKLLDGYFKEIDAYFAAHPNG